MEKQPRAVILTAPGEEAQVDYGTGPKSAQFTVNAMYVIGQITGATVKGELRL